MTILATRPSLGLLHSSFLVEPSALQVYTRRKEDSKGAESFVIRPFASTHLSTVEPSCVAYMPQCL